MTVHTYVASGNWASTAPAYNDAANAVQIEEHDGCPLSVVSCTTGNATGGAILPDVDVGESVKVYITGSNTVIVYFPTGHTVGGQGLGAVSPQSNANYYGNVNPGFAFTARKVASTDWIVESYGPVKPF